MNSFFDKFPEFILTDPRINRPSNKGLGYTVTPDLMYQRHVFSLPKHLVSGKKILDLGCCVGYTGAWVLSNNASFYQGIEIDDSLSTFAEINLSKYFDKDKWSIINSSTEDYINLNFQHFDIIILFGIIYGLKDPVACLEKIADKTNCIIIDSYYNFNEFKKVNKDCDINFLENTPIILLVNDQIISIGDRSKKFPGLFLSPGFIKDFLLLQGFTNDISLTKIIKHAFPEYAKNRYTLRFNKKNKPKCLGLSSSSETINWKNNDMEI